jgi:hypothetical protein
MVVADFNGDGKPDVVISAPYNTDGSEVELLLGKGDGTFAPATSLIGNLNLPYQVVTSDFNRDGKPDIAIVSYIGVTVLLGDGAGGFSSPAGYAIVDQGDIGIPSALVVADFNGDGIPDIAAGTSDGSTIQVFLGNGDGTFQNGLVTTYASIGGGPQSPGWMGAADFNGDGHVDLFLIANPGQLLLGNGDGTFQAPIQVANPKPALGAGAVAVADLNGDHKPDIVLTNDSINQLVSILNTPGTAGSAIVPAVFDFGAQVVGATAAATTVTISNPGTSAMEFSGLAISDTTDFSATSTCGSTVAPAALCAITVTFKPETTGEKTLTVTFTTNDPLSAAGKISVTGNAIAPVVSTSPAELQFSYQKVGTTSTAQTLQITNGGVGALTLAVSIQGDFQQTNNCFTSLAQGASCTVSITYSPLVPGSEVGRLVMTTNAVPAQSAVPLTGIGYVVGPTISVSPSSFNFGSQYVGTSSAPSVVTVENTGDAPFTISSVAASTGFVPLSTCGNSVQPSFSCAIGIFFDPASTGSQTGTLTITDNLSSSPQTVALTGNGTAIAVGPSADSSTAETLSGGKAAYQLSVAPVAGFSGTVNLSCVELAAGYTCALSQPSVVLNGSASASFTVSVTAAATAGLRPTPGPGIFSRIAFACPIALIFLGAGIYPKWRRHFLAIGLLVVAVAFTSSCTSSPNTTDGSSQTYVFLLQSQPASGITIEAPLTLTVPNQ